MAFEALYQPDILHKLLSYDADCGTFIWRHRPIEMFPNSRAHAAWNGNYADKPAFTSLEPSGYLQAYLLCKKVRAHRIAWAMYYGAWPKNQIDHINGVRSDNRIHNLRNVPNVINARNMRIRDASVYAGVRKSKNGRRWISTITIDYKTIYLGTFDSSDEAIQVRRQAELRAGFRPLEIISAT